MQVPQLIFGTEHSRDKGVNHLIHWIPKDLYVGKCDRNLKLTMPRVSVHPFCLINSLSCTFFNMNLCSWNTRFQRAQASYRHIYIYIYMCVCVCVSLQWSALLFYYWGHYTNTTTLELQLSHFQACETVASNHHIVETNANVTVDAC